MPADLREDLLDPHWVVAERRPPPSVRPILSARGAAENRLRSPASRSRRFTWALTPKAMAITRDCGAESPQARLSAPGHCPGAERRAVADAAALFGGERLGGHAWGIDDDPGIASTGTDGDGHRPAGRSRSQDGAPLHRPWPRAPGLRAAYAGAEEHGSVPALPAGTARGPIPA